MTVIVYRFGNPAFAGDPATVSRDEAQSGTGWRDCGECGGTGRFSGMDGRSWTCVRCRGRGREPFAI